MSKNIYKPPFLGDILIRRVFFNGIAKLEKGILKNLEAFPGWMGMAPVRLKKTNHGLFPCLFPPSGEGVQGEGNWGTLRIPRED